METELDVLERLYKEWHPTKNLPQQFDDVLWGSGKNVWWLGLCGHEWLATPKYRKRGFGQCPICVSLAHLEPAIAAQWHPTRNKPLTPAEVRSKSGRKVWWLGDCGHEWEMTVKNRTQQKQGRPICANQKLAPGINDFATMYPHLAAQWHPNRNSSLQPSDVFPSCKQLVWWQAECGHEWQASPASRVSHIAQNQTQCPICSSIAVQKPEWVTQWHPVKNGISTPENTSPQSDKPIWWLETTCGHEWKQTPRSRFVSQTGKCLICMNKQVIPGVNDLATTHPHLVNEWDRDCNSVAINQVTFGSQRKVHWVSSQGHKWCAIIADRSRGFGCPYCVNIISRAECEIRKHLENLGLSVETNIRTIIGKELDLYVPSRQIAIEYNGLYWHTETKGKHKYYHYDKWWRCKQSGIQLIQIWEDDWTKNKKLILRMLERKMGVSSESRIGARNCTIVKIPHKDATDFLNINHIQGAVTAAVHVGLRTRTGELVAVMSLKKTKNTGVWELTRYATNQIVQGGFSKLLTWVENNLPLHTLVTFADHTVSNGQLYEQNGFQYDKELSPDYCYRVGNERHHKFNYRLQRFRDDSSLVWEIGKTERELAALNNLERIWDAGKTRYLRQKDQND